MPLIIIPLKTILFQIIILLISITTESILFYYYLQFSQKKSIQYSTSINLFSSTFIWFLFFIAQSNVPEQWRLKIASYILFHRTYESLNDAEFAVAVVISLLLLFLATCLAELKMLDLLQAFLQSSQDKASKRPRLVKRLNVALSKNNPKNAFAVIIGNSLSGILILSLLTFIANYT